LLRGVAPRSLVPTLSLMFENDYVMRIVKQVAEAIARMLNLSDDGDHDRALREADDAWDLLGVPRELVAAVDTRTLAGLLRGPEGMRLAAELSLNEGKVLEAKRDPMNAFASYRRALELILEARARAPKDDDLELIRYLVKRVPQEYLPEEYRLRD
jgi:hypothetical protein